MAKFTLLDMKRFAHEAWGPLGLRTVERWQEFNRQYFGGKLKPVPLVISQTLPFGSKVGLCSYKPGTSGRIITVNVPKYHAMLLADNGVLLHEMIHQVLCERGVDPSHASDGWRQEIMRLHKQITETEIWAGRSITKRMLGNDGKKSKVIRINEPLDGKKSLGQDEIARWPHSCGIKLGKLGA